MEWIIWESFLTQATMYDKWGHCGGSCCGAAMIFLIHRLIFSIKYYFRVPTDSIQRVFKNSDFRIVMNRAAWRSALICFALGIGLEFYQRVFSIPDVIANLIGLTIFMLAVWRRR